MKRFSSIGFFTLAALALAASTQDVTLRRQLTTNAQEVYKVEMNGKTVMDIPQAGEQDLDINAGMVYTMKTGAVAEDKADLDFVISDIKMEFSGSAAQMMPGTPEMPKEMKFKGKIDQRNRITDFKPEGKLDMMTLQMAGTASTMSMFIEFPEGPVKTGDSWKVKMPKNVMIGNEEAELTATLLGEKDGKWELKMVGDLKIKNDLSEMMKAQDPTGGGIDMQMVLTGTMKVDSVALVNKTTGQTQQMTMQMTSKSVMEIVNMGMKMDQSSKATLKMTLQEK